MPFFSWFTSTRHSKEKLISTFNESDIRWINEQLEYASTFLAVCFIHFDFDETIHTIFCYRSETHNQPRLELGRLERVSAKKWKRFWEYICDSTQKQRQHLKPLEGEKGREFIIWTSPKQNKDPYSATPNTISIKLCISYPEPADQQSECGRDGPCACH